MITPQRANEEFNSSKYCLFLEVISKIDKTLSDGNREISILTLEAVKNVFNRAILNYPMEIMIEDICKEYESHGWNVEVVNFNNWKRFFGNFGFLRFTEKEVE